MMLAAIWSGTLRVPAALASRMPEGVAVGNVPIATPEDVQTITTDQARMVEAIQQGL